MTLLSHNRFATGQLQISSRGLIAPWVFFRMLANERGGEAGRALC